MKKWMCLLVVMTMVLSLVACGGTQRDMESTATVSSPLATEETTVAPTEVPTVEPTEETTLEPTEESVEKVRPDVIQMVINSDGSATNAVADGPAITAHGGSKTVSVDPVTGLNVAQLTGGTCLYNAQIGDYYGDMEDGFMVEVYFKIDSLPTVSYWGIADNCEAGGFGLYVVDGKIRFDIHIDGAYQKVADTKAIETGRWYHVMFGWDSDVLCLYIDGQLVAEYETNYGRMGFPPNATAQYLAIGGCCAAGSSGGQGIVGSIGVCNLYLGGMDADQVAAIYSDLMQ